MKTRLILFILAIILFVLGYITIGGGHPALVAGVITWPFAIFIILGLIVDFLTAKPVMMVLAITLGIYLLCGIIFAVAMSRYFFPYFGNPSFINVTLWPAFFPYLFPL